jgi:hypothetical protein
MFERRTCAAQNETGITIAKAIKTGFKKSLESSTQMFFALAPNTFRIHISLLRFSARKEDNPNSPRQEMKIAMQPNSVAVKLTEFHSSNLFW